MNDLRFACRQLLKNPSFTAIAILTLAIGIGANTAIFSFVNAILLRPLPFKDPERLVMIFESHPENGWSKNNIGAPVLAEWRKQATSFEGIAARGGAGFILTGRGEPQNVPGARFSANIFSLLGVRPVLGRDFQPEEETYGNHRVVLLSQKLWERQFGGDPNIIGQNITLNSEPYQVVGVLPAKPAFPDGETQLWVPLAFSPGELRQRHAHNYLAYGRLKPGVTLEQARAEMNLVAERMVQANDENKGWGAEVYSLHEIMVGDSRLVLLFLLGAVSLVLLIGCANIANLLLARSAARTREFAIRASLGASRWQMVRQLLVESLVLALAGGALGTFLAVFGLELLVRVSPPDLPRIWEGIQIDHDTLTFTAAVSVLTGILFGMGPALQTSTQALARELNESARGTVSLRKQRLRATLVTGEVAISLMLLIGAGLMIRSFSRLISQQIGFNPEHVISMGVGLPDKKYPEQRDRIQFFDQFLAKVQSSPGIESAGLVLGLPLSGQNNQLSLSVVGAPPPAPGEPVSAGYSQVSPGYFRTMNIPLIQGRDFNIQDSTNGIPTLIVNETFVRNFRLGTNVIGRLVNVGDGTEKAEIIGIVKDVKRAGMAENPGGEMYRPYRQVCWGYMTLVVRTKGDPTAITQLVRNELASVDKDQPLENIRTMTQLVASSVAQRRLSVQLLGGFAAVALLLAALGLYGVLAYSVTQRTREIGIRMALGAQRQDVLRLIIQQGMTLAVIGIAAGLVGTVILARLIQSLLFGVGALDPVTFATLPLVLALVALIACWIPASRATRVDPINALRQE